MCSAGRDRQVVFYDAIDRRRVVKRIATSDRLASVCFSSDGLTLACGSQDGVVLVYDLRKTNQMLNVLKGHERTEVSGVQFMRKLRSSGSFTGQGIQPVEVGSRVAGTGLADPLLDISNGAKKEVRSQKSSFGPKRDSATIEEELKEGPTSPMRVSPKKGSFQGGGAPRLRIDTSSL